MKKWLCVQVGHHEKVGGVIQEAQKDGWNLHTYTTAGPGGTFTNQIVNHYLLFVKEE
jgi:hypothetical protein